MFFTKEAIKEQSKKVARWLMAAKHLTSIIYVSIVCLVLSTHLQIIA